MGHMLTPHPPCQFLISNLLSAYADCAGFQWEMALGGRAGNTRNPTLPSLSTEPRPTHFMPPRLAPAILT